jgi:uncharacterized protein (UPF0276 family)
VSWSSAAAELPDLEQLVDIVEAPAWDMDSPLTAGRRHVLLHNLDLNVSLADPGYVDSDWADRACAAVDRAATPWFSMHLGFACEKVHFDGHMLPMSEPLPRDELLERVAGNVERARVALPVPLLLENLDYCPEGAYEHVCEPDFIHEVLERTDTRLLLDLGHLLVTSSWFGRSVESLLEELPLERVHQLHISSPRPLDGNADRLDDVHDVVTEREVQLLQQVLTRANPRAVVLEYRRDAVRLREQLAWLGSVIGRRWRGRPC